MSGIEHADRFRQARSAAEKSGWIVVEGNVFGSALAQLRIVIRRLQELDDQEHRKKDLSDAYLLLGLSHLAMRQEPDVLETFRRVLAVDPGRYLDREVYSPRVLSLRTRAREVPARPPVEETRELADRPAVSAAAPEDAIPLPLGPTDDT